jgi:hypothetical protein
MKINNNNNKNFSAQTPTTPSTQHICSSIESVSKNDTCPDPTTFSIIDEDNKNDTTWTLDFAVNILFLFLFNI